MSGPSSRHSIVPSYFFWALPLLAARIHAGLVSRRALNTAVRSVAAVIPLCAVSASTAVSVHVRCFRFEHWHRNAHLLQRACHLRPVRSPFTSSPPAQYGISCTRGGRRSLVAWNIQRGASALCERERRTQKAMVGGNETAINFALTVSGEAG